MLLLICRDAALCQTAGQVQRYGAPAPASFPQQKAFLQEAKSQGFCDMNLKQTNTPQQNSWKQRWQLTREDTQGEPQGTPIIELSWKWPLHVAISAHDTGAHKDPLLQCSPQQKSCSWLWPYHCLPQTSCSPPKNPIGYSRRIPLPQGSPLSLSLFFFLSAPAAYGSSWILGQGWNLGHSCNQSHSNDKMGSLICWAMRGLPKVLFSHHLPCFLHEVYLHIRSLT